MSTLNVDLDLIRKYNVAAPRYTSYPPATQFAELEGDAVLERMREAASSTRDLSLYFHLPFCYSLCWYCGCTTVITANQSVSGKYVEYLKREMAMASKLINPERKAVQLHFGGGTPTYLLPEEIRDLGRAIQSNFQFAPDIEAGVEIDPRRIVRDHISALKDAGFNRASMGVQDFNPEVQKAVHRIQSREETERTIQWLREDGFKSLNIDLIYGLPHQTVETFSETLDSVIELNPDRLAIFNYAHVPWMKPAQKILKVLPTPELKLELLKLTVERLSQRGYVYIGMDHFAREQDELTVAQRNKTLQRNFQGYSTRGHADIHAFGMSSISQGYSAYWQNEKELPHYYAAIDAGRLPVSRGYVLTKDDLIRRKTIMRLMCDMSLDYPALSELLGLDFRAYFARELDSMGDLEADGLLVRHADGLTVTDLGRLLIRNIAVRFDAYHAERKELRFSKSI
jgi:oxygen-independent coproporphyrinogen-3 oxidase